MNKKNKLLAVLFIVGCIAIICIAGVVKVVSKGNFGNDDVICEGASIDGVDIGGMTKEEAKSAVDKHISKLNDRTITVNVNGKSVKTSFGEAGFRVKENDYVDKAFKIGKTGNFFERFIELGTVKEKDITYKLSYYVDDTVTTQFVEEQCSAFDVKAKNSRLKLKNGKFRASKSRTGVEVQVGDTVSLIVSKIEGNVKDDNITVDAVVETTEPKYSTEMVSKCKDLLGTFTTDYSRSTSARANNVQTAVGYINGTVLYPGQTFSTVKVIKDRTEANGYQSAPEYSSGKVVNGIGGGVCQVSTTLYNAVINAELKVVERSPHSMVVGYVPVSRDAAISGDYKDFKFRNDTDAPVYIAGSAEGGYITFKIYGEETRAANRKIEFQSETTQTIQPGPEVVTVDPSQPASYRQVTQSAHVGYKANLWKIVYIDGVQKEKILVNSSSYSAEPQYVTVGKAVEPSPEPSETPRAEATKEPANTKKPAATKSPSATKAPKEDKKTSDKPKSGQ